MFSFLNPLNNVVVKYSSHCKYNESFSNLFFDKFKNLLDDYIVNYFIKYLFYFLFISFFFLELSYGLFSMIHSNYNLYFFSSDNILVFSHGIIGSFLVDSLTSLISISFFNVLYDFFAFNVDSFVLLISVLTGNSLYVLYILTTIMIFLADLFVVFLHRNKIQFSTFLISFLIYSLFFFMLFTFNLISLYFYVFFTFLLFITLSLLNFKELTKLDYILFCSIISISILPIYFSLFLFFLLFFIHVKNEIFSLICIFNTLSVEKIINLTFNYLLIVFVFNTLSVFTPFPFSLTIFSTLCFVVYLLYTELKVKE